MLPKRTLPSYKNKSIMKHTPNNERKRNDVEDGSSLRIVHINYEAFKLNMRRQPWASFYKNKFAAMVKSRISLRSFNQLTILRGLDTKKENDSNEWA